MRETASVSGKDAGPFVPGFRCPDLNLERVDGSTTRLYQVLSYNTFCVLRVNNGDIQIPEEAAPFCDVWDLIVDEKATDGHAEQNGHVVNGNPKRLYYSSAPLPSWVSGIVVRPDAYVGYVGEDASKYLSGIFQK